MPYLHKTSKRASIQNPNIQQIFTNPPHNPLSPRNLLKHDVAVRPSPCPQKSTPEKGTHRRFEPLPCKTISPTCFLLSKAILVVWLELYNRLGNVYLDHPDLSIFVVSDHPLSPVWKRHHISNACMSRHTFRASDLLSCWHYESRMPTPSTLLQPSGPYPFSPAQDRYWRRHCRSDVERSQPF